MLFLLMLSFSILHPKIFERENILEIFLFLINLKV
jgi:hypothetical protein